MRLGMPRREAQGPSTHTKSSTAYSWSEGGVRLMAHQAEAQIEHPEDFNVFNEKRKKF